MGASQRDTAAETAEFFRNREEARLEAGGQLPYFPNWQANNANHNGHEVHYITYAFQARYGSDAYRLFSEVESALADAGIRPEPAKWVHASAFSISRELHFGPRDRHLMLDLDAATATMVQRKAEAYTAKAKPFSLELTGRLVIMPNTLTYEVADFGPYLKYLEGLWEAVPEFANMKTHPKDPTKSPVDDPDGAAALFQAAYGTAAYDFEIVRNIADASRSFEGATIELSRLHRLWHNISFDREDGVTFPASDLSANGPEAPTHWSTMPTEIIEMKGRQPNYDLAL